MNNRPLKNTTILITRPAHQAEPLAELLKQQGANPIIFPTLEIHSCLNKIALAQLDKLSRADIIIFTSANAVWACKQQLKKMATELNKKIIAVMGQATAEALAELKINNIILPQQPYSSENLLIRPELQQVNNQQIIIITGAGGRDVLSQVLEQRGATITKIISYERRCPKVDTTATAKLLAQGQIDVIICTSNEILQNLATLLPQEELMELPIVAISDRIRPLMEQLGFQQTPIITSNTTNAAIVAALIDWKVKHD